MKLQRHESIKNYPPKLKQLAIQRAQEYSSVRKMDDILNSNPWHMFNVSGTEEGSKFWTDVCEGREFKWEEKDYYPQIEETYQIY